MVDWLIVTIASFGIAFVISRVSIFIHLRFLRNCDDDFIKVDIYLPRNILLYSMKIPVIELVKHNNLPWIESEVKAEEGKTKTHVRREKRFVKVFFNIYFKHPRRFRKLMRKVRYYHRLYTRLMNEIIKAIYCEKFYWKTTFGCDDAASTAVVTGALWSVKSLLVNYLQSRTNFKEKPVVKVIPAFGQEKIDIELLCIFSIKLGNVIDASKRVLYTKAKEVKRDG
ncbi:DUF2953 domain-containing protein [Dendrosporobacter sp. 1207_IL3150]|uniref:DUF2953 domain-containing protein n=1 Tax=Dendrosporobacter sp. 1207_IL3150 TaxID=3084054 RepID=UPI002FD9424C